MTSNEWKNIATHCKEESKYYEKKTDESLENIEAAMMNGTLALMFKSLEVIALKMRETS